MLGLRMFGRLLSRMPYLFEEEILNIGVYQDASCMDDGPTIHSFDNGISEYSASVMRDHFDTAEKTAALWGQAGNLVMCVKLRNSYGRGWKDLDNYNDITDEPCEPTKEFHVRVTQVNDFIIAAEDAADARRKAAEDYIWDENQRHPNRYHADIDVEEIDD